MWLATKRETKITRAPLHKCVCMNALRLHVHTWRFLAPRRIGALFVSPLRMLWISSVNSRTLSKLLLARSRKLSSMHTWAEPALSKNEVALV